MTTTKHYMDYLLAPLNMNHLLTLNGITILQLNYLAPQTTPINLINRNLLGLTRI